MDGRTDRQKDGVTALLDLLSPSAMQVTKMQECTLLHDVIFTLKDFEDFQEIFQ